MKPSSGNPTRAGVRRLLRWITHGAPRSGIARSRRTQIESARERCALWTRSPGVVGLGIGRRIRGGRLEREVVLKVYVEEKLPPSACPVVVDRAIELDGHTIASTDVVALGKFQLHASPLLHWARPIRSGLGIGNALTKSTGTLGCFVRRSGDSSSDALYVMSCAHVLASAFPVELDEVILQPSREYYGSPANHRIARLADVVQLDDAASGPINSVDAAIGELDPEAIPDLSAADWLPTGVSDEIGPDMSVHGLGAASGEMGGVVLDPDFVLLDVPYPGVDGEPWFASFHALVLCTGYGTERDSGAAILDDEDRLIGLHMGRFSDAAVFCRIATALDLLGVEPVLR